MKQKKLIIFFPSIGNGGVEKNFYIISNFLIRKVKNISIITSNPQKINFLNKKINVVSSKFSFYKKNRTLQLLFCIFLLISEIIKNKNVVVLSFQSNSYATIICYLLGVKIVSRANSSPKNFLKNGLKKFLYVSIMRLSSEIIVNSREMKLDFKKDFNLQSNLIYNPLNKQEITKKAQKKIKNGFLKKIKHLKIINIGRLDLGKDQLTLLKALNLIKNKIKFQLILVGRGPEKRNLQNFIKNNKLNKNVKIVDYQKNPYPILKSSDLFILTSRYEGLPNVLLEAITLKKLIISSDCSTGPKEILQNGKAGILFKTGDYYELYKKILSLKQNKEENKKKILIATKSLKKYDFNLNLNKYLKILDNLEKN
tara:strand:- start:235 stop:1338 length:1104 start_codon:yes stop_codon:yes gene_type:complete